MMRYRYMVLTALLAVAGSAVADGLRVEDMTMSAGESRQVEIELENGTNGYVAFQFEMVLPDGITLGTDGEGKPLASLDSGRASDHVLSVTETAANTYRFLSYSMTNAELKGTAGPLLHVTLQTDEDAYEGKRKVKIQNQVFTERSEMQHKWSDVIFMVEVAVPVITVEDKQREYGEENPKLTYEASSWLTGTPELTTTAAKDSPVGEYPITVERGTVEGKYTTVNGTLTITKAPLTITAGNYTIRQGDPLPAFAVTYDGFKNGETENVLTTKPTLTTKATSKSKPGTYEIEISGADAENYDITYINGKLTIEAGTFTLTYVVDGETYKTIEVEYGTSITAEAEPTKEGYTFSGWSEIPSTMPAEDVTVTGAFTVNTYKLTYMIDGKVYKEVEYEYGAAITPEPQPEGDYQSFEWTELPETMPAHDVVVEASYTSGIVDILKKQQDVRIYAPNGKPLKHLQKGVNIIRMNDGTVRKLLVK